MLPSKAAGFAILFLLPLGIATDTAAQTAPAPWRHTLEIDLVGAGLDGYVNEGDVSGVGAASHLHMGGMLAYRAAGERSAILANVTYVPLAASKRTGNEFWSSGYDVHADQLTLDLDYAVRMSKAVELLLGARVLSCRCTVSSFSYGQWAYTSEQESSWVDPVIGVQALVPLSDVLSFAARADFGGFSVASSMTWQVMAALDYRVSRTTTLHFGFRAFSDEYGENSNGHFPSRYDIRSAGPLLGVVISL